MPREASAWRRRGRLGREVGFELVVALVGAEDEAASDDSVALRLGIEAAHESELRPAVAEIVEGLKKIGHKTTSVVGPLGGGQAIWIDWEKGTLTGGSDPRKDGCALG